MKRRGFLASLALAPLGFLGFRRKEKPLTFRGVPIVFTPMGPEKTWRPIDHFPCLGGIEGDPKFFSPRSLCDFVNGVISCQLRLTGIHAAGLRDVREIQSNVFRAVLYGPKSRAIGVSLDIRETFHNQKDFAHVIGARVTEAAEKLLERQVS